MEVNLGRYAGLDEVCELHDATAFRGGPGKAWTELGRTVLGNFDEGESGLRIAVPEDAQFDSATFCGYVASHIDDNPAWEQELYDFASIWDRAQDGAIREVRLMREAGLNIETAVELRSAPVRFDGMPGGMSLALRATTYLSGDTLRARGAHIVAGILPPDDARGADPLTPGPDFSPWLWVYHGSPSLRHHSRRRTPNKARSEDHFRTLAESLLQLVGTLPPPGKANEPAAPAS
ncbi:MAG TPA: hypothetical protein VLF40_04450 [Candidatus Saccharimonadales bacterium]|nr:hypothetical protein [Candidatus Saccharimonadales bacterium]